MISILVFATDEKNFGLSGSDSKMRELRKIVFEDYALNKFRRNLLCSISLFKEQNNFLITMIDFEAIIKLVDMENTALTRVGLADYHIGWQLQPLSNGRSTIIDTF